MDETEPKSPPLSKTPSWIMLGFLLGAGFVWLLPRPGPEIIEVPVKDDTPPPLVAVRTKPDFSELEAVFNEWQQYAVWDNNRTEVALWDIEAGQYARFYEVLREGDAYYYRSIPALTRPVLTHGVDTSAPLLFTEPDERRREWLRQRDEETWKAIQNSIKRTPPPGKPSSSEN
ncbi:MAG: hypothetical protein H7A44_09645 [Opitutaceae bacterium]|nr:hypothetical protein [Cephaloticoccus sp.]MCP5530690.1 hypothetical protein [Opitutaceae bacterium]